MSNLDGMALELALAAAPALAEEYRRVRALLDVYRRIALASPYAFDDLTDDDRAILATDTDA